MIDLTQQSTLAFTYASDPASGVTTVTVADGDGNQLGQLKVETARVRSLLQAMSTTLAELIPDTTLGLQRCRTDIDVVLGTAKTVF